MFVFQYYGTSQSSFSTKNAQKKFGFEKYLCQNFGTSHLFKGNQVFKFETEYKINVYFLIFIALPIVHCFRHYWGVIGPQSGSKWPKYHFVAMSQSCGSKLVEQGWNKSKHTQAMSWNHFSGQECSLGGPITQKMSEKELNGAITDHKRPF